MRPGGCRHAHAHAGAAGEGPRGRLQRAWRAGLRKACSGAAALGANEHRCQLLLAQLNRVQGLQRGHTV